jgi:hypothetical protein
MGDEAGAIRKFFTTCGEDRDYYNIILNNKHKYNEVAIITYTITIYNYYVNTLHKYIIFAMFYYRTLDIKHNTIPLHYILCNIPFSFLQNTLYIRDYHIEPGSKNPLSNIIGASQQYNGDYRDNVT